jgi:hypothetical protein
LLRTEFDNLYEVPMGILTHDSLFALLTLGLGVTPLLMAIVYVIRPSERNLALMRPLSLVAMFAAVAGGVLGAINVLRYMATRDLTAESQQVMIIGAAESLVPVFVGFASLAIAWLLVTVGMGRQDARQ